MTPWRPLSFPQEDADDSKDTKGGKKEDKARAATQSAAQAARAERVAAARAAMASTLRPKYITPADVEEIMKRLWRNEWGVLQHIYGSETGRSPASPAAKAEGYKMFFLHAVAVTPNKFRCVQQIMRFWFVCV